MSFIIRFIAIVLVLTLVPVAAYGVFRAATGVYDYETRRAGVYMEGCPYPMPDAFPAYGRGASCRWTKTGYSGFNIGIDKHRMLQILCNGNRYGKYLAPLRAESKPIMSPDGTSSYIVHVDYEEFPCGEHGALRMFDTFYFERQSSAWELKRHVEQFTLQFDGDKLTAIDVLRYSQFFPDIDFKAGETFEFLKGDEASGE